MPVLDIDLTQGVLKDGTFTATITKCEQKTSNKADGGTYLEWVFYIPEQGQNIFHITSLKPTALFGLRNLLSAIGVQASSSGFNTDDAIGKQISVTLATIEDPAYGPQIKVKKISKA